MICTIQNHHFTAKIDTLGAQLISLSDKSGLEYIWQREQPFWQSCAPVLFPVVGRCKNGVITVNGTDYPMPQCHGFASSKEFDVVRNPDALLTLRLCDDQDTRLSYPFAFCFEITFCLQENTLTVRYRVVNHSDSDMPFGIGAHPGFRCPLLPEENFNDYELDFGKPVTLDTTCVDENFVISSTLLRRIVTDSQTLQLHRNLFAADALIFENPPFGALAYRSRKSGKGIYFSFDSFSTFAVWTEAPPSSAGFVCLEPWNGMGMRSGEGTDLSAKKDVIILPPNEEFCCSYCVTPLGE